MIGLFKYMFYRIARVVKQFGDWGEKNYDVYALAYISICLIINALPIVFFILDSTLGIYPACSFEFFIKYLGVPLIILMGFTLPFDDNGVWYKELDKKYKNERFKALKGWLIVIYMIASFVSFVVFMIASMQQP